MIAMHSANPLTSFLFNKRFGESCRNRANNEKKLKSVRTLAHYGTSHCIVYIYSYPYISGIVIDSQLTSKQYATLFPSIYVVMLRIQSPLVLTLWDEVCL